MPARWQTGAYTCLMVALLVAESAQVELTVQDHVRLDRVTPAGAARGRPCAAGTTLVRLAKGTYVFPNHPGRPGERD